MRTNRFDYTFEPGRLRPHEVAMLGSGQFNGFFHTSFLFGAEKVTAVYECDGYAPLSTFRIEQTGDVLYVLEKILLILQCCPEYMIVPERVLLIPETVFYRLETGDVRMTFIPVVGDADIHRNILLFLARAKVDLCDPFTSYIDRFVGRSCSENLDISSMLTLAGVLRRELDEKLSEIA